MMSVDDIVKLLDAIVKLINVLVWPAMLLFILRRFGQDLRDFIKNLGELSLKGGGFEASLKRKQVEVAAALAAAKASRSDGDMNRESAAKEAKIAADVASGVVTSRTIKRVRLSKVLWVDDRPNNNIYERQALEALGVSFTLATSTDEALQKISQQRFDAIISDIGRSSDSRAGYTLLDQLRANSDQTPFFIYASSRDPEHVAESRRHGATGCTNNANELLEMVLPVLGRPV
jgi:CheY-like chemotaxis protein